MKLTTDKLPNGTIIKQDDGNYGYFLLQILGNNNETLLNFNSLPPNPLHSKIVKVLHSPIDRTYSYVKGQVRSWHIEIEHRPKYQEVYALPSISLITITI